MTMDRTQEIVRAYVDALLSNGDFGQYLADDVVVKMPDVNQEIRGRQAAVDGIVSLHRTVFDARPEFVDLVIGEGKAAAEAIFVGTHNGEFAGIPATGKSVRVPYSAFYRVRDDKITEVGLYGFASGLIMQLTAGTAAQAPTA